MNRYSTDTHKEHTPRCDKRTITSCFMAVYLAEKKKKQSYKDNRYITPYRESIRICLYTSLDPKTWGKSRRRGRGNRRERSELSCVIVADYYQVLLCAHGQPLPPALINNSYINESRTNTAADHHSQTMTGESGLC